jgi:MFS family permease
VIRLQPRSTPASPIVGMSMLPFGLVFGFMITGLPFLLALRHVAVDKIATMSAIVFSPTFWAIGVTPIVDAGLTRRVYAFLLTTVSALSLGAALWLFSPGRLAALTALLMIAELTIVLQCSAVTGWMAEFLKDSERGKASGWINAAILGGGALISMAVMSLARRLPLAPLGWLIAAAVLASSLTLWCFPKSAAPVIVLRQTFIVSSRNLWRTAKQREVQSGLLTFVSPAGCVAAINLFAALGNDYHVSERQVVWITGAGCAIASSCGAILGGVLADRVPRLYLYLSSGLLSAACALAMAFSPHTATAYAFGVLAYNMAAGLAFAAGCALAFQLAGESNPSASTQLGLCFAGMNLATVYMTWLDGQAYHSFGAKGLLCTDGIASLLGVIALMAYAHPMNRERSGLRLLYRVPNSLQAMRRGTDARMIKDGSEPGSRTCRAFRNPPHQ